MSSRRASACGWTVQFRHRPPSLSLGLDAKPTRTRDAISPCVTERNSAGKANDNAGCQNDADPNPREPHGPIPVAARRSDRFSNREVALRGDRHANTKSRRAQREESVAGAMPHASGRAGPCPIAMQMAATVVRAGEIGRCCHRPEDRPAAAGSSLPPAIARAIISS